MKLSSVILILLGVLTIGLLGGCGDGRPARVPVAGTVTIDGKPLKSGSVTLHPAQGRPGVGRVVDGRFRLTTFEKDDGVVQGTHAVSVHAVDQLGPNTLRWNVPKKYLNAGTSGVTKSIDSPTENLQIELSWGNEPGPYTETTSGD